VSLHDPLALLLRDRLVNKLEVFRLSTLLAELSLEGPPPPKPLAAPPVPASADDSEPEQSPRRPTNPPPGAPYYSADSARFSKFSLDLETCKSNSSL
jgi:hypothetical protein